MVVSMVWYSIIIPVKITGSRSRNLFVGTIQNSHLKWFTKTKSDQELNLYKNQNRPRFSPYKKNHIFLSNPPWFPFVTSLVRLVGKSKPFCSGKNEPPLNSICAKKTLLQIVCSTLGKSLKLDPQPSNSPFYKKQLGFSTKVNKGTFCYKCLCPTPWEKNK